MLVSSLYCSFTCYLKVSSQTLLRHSTPRLRTRNSEHPKNVLLVLSRIFETYSSLQPHRIRDVSQPILGWKVLEWRGVNKVDLKPLILSPMEFPKFLSHLCVFTVTTNYVYLCKTITLSPKSFWILTSYVIHNSVFVLSFIKPLVLIKVTLTLQLFFHILLVKRTLTLSVYMNLFKQSKDVRRE